MKFFIDNCLPPRWAPALSALADPGQYSVKHLRDEFAANVTDIEWIKKLGEDGDWIILSGDVRITRNPHEREAWRRSGLTAFFLPKQWSDHRMWEKTWRIVRWWPRIIEQAKLVKPGAGFIVPLNFGSNGRFEQVPLR